MSAYRGRTMWEQRFRRVLAKREGVAIALWGEAGIGKTHGAIQMLAGLSCQSVTLHATLPLASLASGLPQTKALPPWARSSLLRLVGGEGLATERSIEAFAAALAAAAPFVLHLEDLHEVGAERLELVRGLALTARRSRGVGLLVTSRSEPPTEFEAFRVEPLPREDVERLLAAELGSGLPKAAGEWIASRSAGNPLFALEYVRFLSRQGYLWSDGRSWHWRRPERDAMPPTIEALLEVVLDEPRRETGLARTLESRAMLPVDADAKLWFEVAGLPRAEFASALRELERRGILLGAEFVHPLYREVILRSLETGQRRSLARRAMSAHADDPLRAAAFLADAQPEPQEALAFLERAALAARNANAHASAARMLDEASRIATGAERGRLALAAASAYNGVDFARMIELAREAEAYGADASEALYLQAVALSSEGRHEAVQRVIDRMPSETKRGSRWLERYSDLLHRTGRYRDLIDVWESSDAREAADGATVYRVGWAYLHDGRLEVAASLSASQRTRRTAPEDLSWVGELEAAVAFYSGRYDEAERVYSELLAELRHPGREGDLTIANVLRNRSLARMQVARYRESVPDLDEALEIYGRAGHAIYYAQTLVMASYAHHELGDFDRAEDALLEASEILRRSEAQSSLVSCLAQLSSLYLHRPGGANGLLARKYAAEAVKLARQLGPSFADLVASCALARAQAATGHPGDALSLAEWVVAEGQQHGFAEVELSGRTARAEALDALGRTAEAREEYRAAQDLAASLGSQLEAAKLGLELDRLEGAGERAAERWLWLVQRGLAAGAAIAERYFPELAQKHGAAREQRPIESAPTLEVLGPLRIRHGEWITPVRGRKAQGLLALLLTARLAGRSEVPRLELTDRLYPDGDEVKAANSLKQLVSSIRSQLGESVISTSSVGYALGRIGSDAEQFLASGDTRRWRGPFLEGLDVDPRGAEVADVVYRELAAAGAGLLEYDAIEAARVARILMEADPYELDHLRLGLLALRNAGNYRSLHRTYQSARARLAEVGEALPEAWNDFLAPAAG